MAAKKKNKKKHKARAPARPAAPKPHAARPPHAGHPKKKRPRRRKSRPSALARCRGPNGTMAQAQAQNPQMENPDSSELWNRALRSMLFGGAAAAAGVLGTMLISKADIKSPLAKAAVTGIGGSLLGGAVGMANPIAGTLIAHNYIIAATRAAFPAEHVGPSAERAARPALAQGARNKALPPAHIQGPDEFGDYRRLEGVMADNMGDADELAGYAPVEGVVADDMGEPDDLAGYAPIEGVIADNMGDADELGEEDMGDSGLFD